MADLSLYKFKADIAKFAQQLDINLATVIRKIALDLWTKVTKKTPVDTGRARASWIVSEGEPDIVTTAPVGTNAVPTPPDFSNVDGTKVVYILNNVSYIEALEDGHSKQAPAGMVRISLAELEVEIESLMIA